MHHQTWGRLGSTTIKTICSYKCNELKEKFEMWQYAHLTPASCEDQDHPRFQKLRHLAIFAIIVVVVLLLVVVVVVVVVVVLFVVVVVVVVIVIVIVILPSSTLGPPSSATHHHRLFPQIRPDNPPPPPPPLQPIQISAHVSYSCS